MLARVSPLILLSSVWERRRKVSSRERAAFVLRHFEEMSTREIGEALGLDEGAAKHSVFRAVRKLREALEPFVASPARVEAQ